MPEQGVKGILKQLLLIYCRNYLEEHGPLLLEQLSFDGMAAEDEEILPELTGPIVAASLLLLQR